MLFYSFTTQKQHRAFGGSEFLEIQFCKLPISMSPKQLVDVSRIVNWQNDSLYVHDENTFYKEYSPILDCGIYNNLKTGPVDIYGINYYPLSVTDDIIMRLSQRTPVDYQVFAEWVRKSKHYNGFYILGI